MKTAISIPDRVFRSAEELAARLGVSRSELYAKALAALVDKHRDDLITSRLNEIYARIEKNHPSIPTLPCCSSARSFEAGRSAPRRDLVGFSARARWIWPWLSTTIADHFCRQLQRQPHQYSHCSRYYIESAPEYANWRRVKKGMPDRYRLFFRFASKPAKIIIQTQYDLWHAEQKRKQLHVVKLAA